MRRIPIVATLVVVAAVAVMVGLGFWQLARLHEKELLLRQYKAALNNPAETVFPVDPQTRRHFYYRRTSFDCPATGEISARAGHNASGRTGWAHWGQCVLPDGTLVGINLGWANAPRNLRWTGGMVRGTIAPDGAGGGRVVNDLPLAGLAASARPDPRDIPNNHLSYAVQWFLFALTALVIYGLALRKRLAGA